MTLDDLMRELDGLNREWGELDAMPVVLEIKAYGQVIGGIPAIDRNLYVANARSIRLDPTKRRLIISEREL